MLLLSVTACRETILHDLDELRANQVIVVLSHAGVEGIKERDGAKWSVSVPKESAPTALETLEESRILKRDLQRFQEEPSGLHPKSRTAGAPFRTQTCVESGTDLRAAARCVRSTRSSLSRDERCSYGNCNKARSTSKRVTDRRSH